MTMSYSLEAMQVSLRGKRDFSDVIKLRILRGGNYPGLSQWAWCNHQGPYWRDTEGVSRRCDDRRRGTERKRFKDAMLLALKRKKVSRWAKGCNWPLEAGKSKETDPPPLGPQKDPVLTLVQWDWFRTSSLQNSKRWICVPWSHQVCNNSSHRKQIQGATESGRSVPSAQVNRSKHNDGSRCTKEFIAKAETLDSDGSC